MRKPLCIDGFCGLGGWAEGFLAQGWDVCGFDIEEHVYRNNRYPGNLWLQEVLTVHGSRFADADCLVMSPPRAEFSYLAMSSPHAKAKRASILADETGEARRKLTALFDACFRMQREACEASGRHIPMVVDNVRGANEWVGSSRWNFGRIHLWGDVPALMPKASRRFKVPGFRFDGSEKSFQSASVSETDIKVLNWSDRTKRGQDFMRYTGQHAEEGIKLSDVGFGVSIAREYAPALKGSKYERTPDDKRRHIGIGRKAASAMIAKIPFELSTYIANVYWPCDVPRAT